MSNIVEKAIQLLKAGKVIAVPTETVYGLAGDACNEQAIRQIFALKNRPADHPVIVHIAGAEQLADWARQIPDTAFQLAKKFWPGPLSFVLKKADHVSSLVTGGQDTIALRSPNHPLTHEILKGFGGGIAAPSANRFGQLSPTCAEHVAKSFPELPLIVDGGPCQVGIESTILDLSSNAPRILRPGMISKEQIERVIGSSVEQAEKTSPRASGSRPSHYAPNTKTTLLKTKELENFILRATQRIILLSFDMHDEWPCKTFVMPKDPAAYAHIIYQTLHDADQKNFELIVIETPPTTPEWSAILDRLTRATK